jgi:hypothetical protein
VFKRHIEQIANVVKEGGKEQQDSDHYISIIGHTCSFSLGVIYVFDISHIFLLLFSTVLVSHVHSL